MKALGLVVSEKKTFLCFSHDDPEVGPVWAPGTRLAGFMKRTFIHTKQKSSGPCGFEEEVFFDVFPIVSLWELVNPEAGPFLTPGAWLAR